ncbi:MAG: branched-chain amino acid ABC transporter ATP-binding protein/permease [Alphaproteobacteria bacterium]|jgi:branched-chain amino acid transport system permease protein|nr:branched-chain amino acid ABC transporter ATP-binding protein/permease [Alphaproteobacteria bacterium]MBT7744567.1 branched-chain amino acid ABC transporter ATP-binding protein/permease [Alphaproteobacteria bacterium]
MIDQRTRECAVSFGLLLPVIIGIVWAASATEVVGRELLLLGCVNIIAAVGLGLFSGTSGILSLGHVAFFGVGAYVAAWFTLPAAMKSFLLPDMPLFVQEAEWSLAMALPVAALVCMLLGVISGAVMMRLRDTSAVIASFGLVVIFYLVFIGAKPLTNGKQSLYGLPVDQATWPVFIGTMVVALGIAFYMKSTRFARNLEATRDEEQASRSIGIEPQFHIFMFWVLSAGIVGLAGALYGHVIGVISPSGFYLEKTFALVAMIILGGYRSVSGCVVGAVVITIAEEIFRKTEEHLGTFAGTETIFGFEFPLVFGLTAISFSIMILIILYTRPQGVLGYREIATMFNVFAANKDDAGKHTELPTYKVSAERVLETHNLSKSYSGLNALEDVGIKVGAGEIIGLIGPNGAGKTTFINVLTGSLFATDGKIELNNEVGTEWSAVKLARKGLGRTFQNIRLFTSLSALENVIAAVTVQSPGLGRREVEATAMGWLNFLNLGDKAHTNSGNLAYGDQRRLEIARALALEPDFLLLDEPVAGMNSVETEDLKKGLQQIVSKFGIGILLVEHDLKMVMQLCDRIYVLNKGQLIAEGLPKDIATNAAVIEAYVGEETDHL